MNASTPLAQAAPPPLEGTGAVDPVRQREVALNEVFKRAGVDVLSLSTDEDLVRAIVRFAMRRRKRRT